MKEHYILYFFTCFYRRYFFNFSAKECQNLKFFFGISICKNQNVKILIPYGSAYKLWLNFSVILLTLNLAFLSAISLTISKKLCSFLKIFHHIVTSLDGFTGFFSVGNHGLGHLAHFESVMTPAKDLRRAQMKIWCIAKCST